MSWLVSRFLFGWVTLRVLLLVSTLFLRFSLIVTRFMFHFWDNFMLFFLSRLSLFGCLVNLFFCLFGFFFVFDLMVLLFMSLGFSFVLFFMLWLHFLMLFMLLMLSLYFLLLQYWLLLLLLLFRMSFSFFSLGFLLPVVSVLVPGALTELPGDVTHRQPIFVMVFVLSAHLDEKPSVQDLLVELFFDEVDRIDLGLEDNLEGAGIVLLDLDELEVGEGSFNILFSCVEVALDEIEGDMLDVIVKVFDFLDEFLFLGDDKLFPLFFSAFHVNNQIQNRFRPIIQLRGFQGILSLIFQLDIYFSCFYYLNISLYININYEHHPWSRTCRFRNGHQRRTQNVPPHSQPQILRPLEDVPRRVLLDDVAEIGAADFGRDRQNRPCYHKSKAPYNNDEQSPGQWWFDLLSNQDQ